MANRPVTTTGVAENATGQVLQNELQQQLAPLDSAALQARVQIIQRVMRDVMIDGTHYGIHPGTDSKTLKKAGADLLLVTFQLNAEPVVEDISGPAEVRYRVTSILRSQNNQAIIAFGVGECSSREDKYAWRRAVCQEEFDDTPETRRRKHWKTGSNGNYSINQILQNPLNNANTVLKMATKRSRIDACLTGLGASDLFAQDLDDPDITQPEGDETPATPPRKTQGAGSGATLKPIQQGLLRRAASNRGISEAALLKHAGVTTIEAIHQTAFNDLTAWISGQPEGTAYEVK